MIKHLVMWRLKDEALGKSKEENGKEIKQRVEALKDSVPGVLELEVGLNFKDVEAASDVGLYSTFDSCEDLENYIAHPLHQEVVQFILEVVDERRVVDYEC